MSSALFTNAQKRVLLPMVDQRYKITRLVCWGVCIVFAALDAWAGRHYTDPDGISYLNMSDSLIGHNWHLLINPHWSPLYPFLIGIATWLTHPSAYWELPLVHAVNFVIFLATLAAFEFLLYQVIMVLGRTNEYPNADSIEPVPAWRWQLLGYSLFAFSTFVLINGLRKVTPDLCVAAFVYLDAGLLLRLRASTKISRICLLLGLALGFGYFAKAILFPMAFVFLATAFLLIYRQRKAFSSVSIALVVFLALAAPLLTLISMRVGRPSFSESGSLNIAWQINGEPMLPFHSANPASHLMHPMALLYKHPDAFGFSVPAASTYPPWQDPWYWNAGANTSFSRYAQFREILRGLAAFFINPYIAPMWGMILGGFILFLMSLGIPHRLRYVANSWPILIPGIAGLVCYTLVLVEARYIGPFILLAILGFFPCILVQKPGRSGTPSAFVTAVVAGFMIIVTASFVVLHLAIPLPILRGHGGLHYRTAQWLNADGLQPGQAVAIIGSGWDAMVWARLARVRIVAQIPQEDSKDFWGSSDPLAKEAVYDAIAKSGAKAIVTEETVPSVGFADWQRIGDTPYHVHFLRSSTNGPISQSSL